MHQNPANRPTGITRPASQGITTGMFWFLVSVTACFYVIILNGGMTFYYDTAAYLERGHALLSRFFELPDLKANVPIADGASGNTERSVGGTRSPVYSVLLGGLAAVKALEIMAILNATLVLAAVWLPIRITARQCNLALPMAKSVAMVILATALGSMPFYVAYLMPDIFAPVLILMVATLVAFAAKMTRFEILLAVALGGVSIVMHVSHIAIVLLLLPCVLVAAIYLARKSWWLAPAITVFLLAVGMAEQVGFRAVVKSDAGKDVTILPFLTARLIQDQIGLDYLKVNCPDDTFATCAMLQSLAKSQDPERFAASNIIFSKDPELGSFRFLEYTEQKAISGEQFNFFFRVLKELPLRTTLAFVNNALIQARLTSVDMTLQTPEITSVLDGVQGLAFGEFSEGRLTKDVSWLAPVNMAQQILYLVSLLVAVFLVVWPGALPRQIKVLVVMLGFGILANALILGGVSQPATRYGSRVIWLLPFAASFCAIVAWHWRHRDINGGSVG